jgi:hypothetical protein
MVFGGLDAAADTKLDDHDGKSLVDIYSIFITKLLNCSCVLQYFCRRCILFNSNFLKLFFVCSNVADT